MTSISLRAYHRQIEEWIDQALYDRAILHCRHLLTIHPKCINTYRLLGKALLENHRFGDASDVFQRVLSSLPDDFISHVGLSIIREDEGNLNEAIWHMERAFEIQPSNNAIQGELKRLYGRKDGLQPPKINLNRGALARMYLKGNLHSQAIAEIRMALAEDPQRPDLEVLLAKAYFESRQYREAEAIAQRLLAKLPYCYEALFLLWRISLLENREKEARGYLTKLAELDPYAAFLTRDRASVELVPDTAVILEKLEETASPVSFSPLSPQPDWATSLEPQTQPEETEDKVLSSDDWITETSPFNPQIAIQPEEQSSDAEFPEGPPQESPVVEIPDWMREFGWQESELGDQSISEEALPTSGHIITPEELEIGEIPDWLREISSIDTEGAEPLFDEKAVAESSSSLDETASAVAGIEGIPSWLAEFEREQTQAEEPPSLAQEELPEWLRKLELNSEVFTESAWDETAPPELPAEPPKAAAILPEAPYTSMQPQAGTPDLDLPEWLKQEVSPLEPEPLPDWLQSPFGLEEFSSPTDLPISEEDTKPTRVSPQPEALEPSLHKAEKGIPALDEDEAFAWLESLAAKQGVEEALLLSPDQRKEEPPSWIREYLESHLDLDTETTEETPPVGQLTEIPQKAEGNMPESTSDQTPTLSEELPEWLRLEIEQEEQLEAEDYSETELPEWLAAVSTEETTEWFQEYSQPTIEVSSQEVFSPASDLAETLAPSQSQEVTDVTQGLLTPTDQASLEALTVDAERQTPVIPEEPRSEAQLTGTISSEARELPLHAQIEEARLALSRGQLDQAISKYQALIRTRRELDQVIQDLSNALYHYPMEVKVWMLLGDAYLRKDLLAEALDAYNKAEELLR